MVELERKSRTCRCRSFDWGNFIEMSDDSPTRDLLQSPQFAFVTSPFWFHLAVHWTDKCIYIYIWYLFKRIIYIYNYTYISVFILCCCSFNHDALYTRFHVTLCCFFSQFGFGFNPREASREKTSRRLWPLELLDLSDPEYLGGKRRNFSRWSQQNSNRPLKHTKKTLNYLFMFRKSESIFVFWGTWGMFQGCVWIFLGLRFVIHPRKLTAGSPENHPEMKRKIIFHPPPFWCSSL